MEVYAVGARRQWCVIQRRIFVVHQAKSVVVQFEFFSADYRNGGMETCFAESHAVEPLHVKVN